MARSTPVHSCPIKGKPDLATVLTIDRDALQQEVLGALLKHDGHRVHPTADAETALAILQSALVDLVIIEPATQRPDGLRLCQQIRQLNPYRPLMVVSERGDEEQIFRALMVAADDYMVKPISPRLFVGHVHALLRRAEQVRGQRWQDQNISIGEISLNLRSEEHTSELQSRENLVCRLLLEKKKKKQHLDWWSVLSSIVCWTGKRRLVAIVGSRVKIARETSLAAYGCRLARPRLNL